MNNEEYEEEKKWLKSTKNKLKKYISSPYWDCIELPDSYYDIIGQIMRTEDPKQLSPSINESIMNYILEGINNKFKQCKKDYRER